MQVMKIISIDLRLYASSAATFATGDSSAAVRKPIASFITKLMSLIMSKKKTWSF